jgi:hypothetical protein
MKSNKIYQISIKGDNKETDSASHPIYKDFSNILDVEDNKYIGFTDDNKIFIRLPDYKFNSFCSLLSKYNIVFDVYDVTEDVIKGDIQKKYPDVEELTPYIFEDFRYDNTSIDDILDKINERGIDSIDDIDKSILAK